MGNARRKGSPSSTKSGQGQRCRFDCGGGAARCEAHYCAVVVRSVVLPEDDLCCAGLVLTPSFLLSFLASALPSICLASAALAAPLCLLFVLLGSYSGRAASAAIC